MTHYLAFVHKDAGSCYGVSFPDVPGIIAAGATLDEAVDQAAEALAFAAEDWHRYTDAIFPLPRSFGAVRKDPDVDEAAKDAVWVAVPLRPGLREAA